MSFYFPGSVTANGSLRLGSVQLSNKLSLMPFHNHNSLQTWSDMSLHLLLLKSTMCLPLIPLIGQRGVYFLFCFYDLLGPPHFSFSVRSEYISIQNIGYNTSPEITNWNSNGIKCKVRKKIIASDHGQWREQGKCRERTKIAKIPKLIWQFCKAEI